MGPHGWQFGERDVGSRGDFRKGAMRNGGAALRAAKTRRARGRPKAGRAPVFSGAGVFRSRFFPKPGAYFFAPDAFTIGANRS